MGSIEGESSFQLTHSIDEMKKLLAIFAIQPSGSSGRARSLTNLIREASAANSVCAKDDRVLLSGVDCLIEFRLLHSSLARSELNEFLCQQSVDAEEYGEAGGGGGGVDRARTDRRDRPTDLYQ